MIVFLMGNDILQTLYRTLKLNKLSFPLLYPLTLENKIVLPSGKKYLTNLAIKFIVYY